MDKFKEYLKTSSVEKNVKNLDYILYILLGFITLYIAVLMYGNPIKLVSNVTQVSTNQPLSLTTNVYEFEKGDVVSIKFHNTQGIVENKTFLPKNHYTILYKTSNGELKYIRIHNSFLSKVN